MVKVNELFSSNGRSWDKQKIRDTFIEEDVKKILSIKICSMAKFDLLGWHYNENDLYSVKSGYWLSTHLPTTKGLQPTYGNITLK